MSPEIQRLFEAACKLPAAGQGLYVESQTDDPAVRREVLSLLAHDALAEPFFANALGSAASSIKSSMDLVPGSRIGAYTIVRMVGRGGMGAVYLATRADGAFDQSVAIKVIDSHSALLRARFQQERQILARLNHPNIARLLDGGEMPSGLPYLVMEFVPGEQIDAYCDQKGLDLQARLRLFLPVAAAVQHAHRHLIVHRDLKPGNILIGEDGTPKLLDFGIAKVLDTGPEAKVSTRVMTPEYASPEQVRGGEITTASDIYSLGAVLYRLLTGKPPHSTEGLSPLDTARQIAEQAVPRAANVPVDVAAILEKALHTDPSHRYRSADDLCDEIHRFLEGKAVLAVEDSFAYRTAKFLRRHWIPVSAMAAVLLALTLGTGVSLWQARKAERRFAEVRQLSNRFLFEFEGSIHSVPGATKARHLVVKTAQEYLDRLAAEGGSSLFGRRDPELTHELAEAYRKLGDVQGNPVDSNAGDSRAALASYRKALALQDSVGDETASDTKLRVGYLTIMTSAANAEAVSGDPALALRLHEKAVVVAESWMKTGAGNADLLNAVANAYSQLSSRQIAGGAFDSAVSNSKRSLELRRQALALRPGDAKLQRGVAVSYWSVATAEKTAGRPEEAVADFTRTLELLRRIAASDPGNAQIRREVLGASWLLASSLHELLAKQKKSLEGDLPLWEDALRTGIQLLKEDPGNALVETDVALISLGFANTLEDSHRFKQALKVLTPAIARQEIRHKSNPDNRPAASYLAIMKILSSECHKDLGELPEALKNADAALGILDMLVRASPDSVEYKFARIQALQSIGNILAAQGDYQGARSTFRRGLEAATTLPAGSSVYDPTPLVVEMKAADLNAASKTRSQPH
jgi:tetratricopeptide (TPR) repeat protein